MAPPVVETLWSVSLHSSKWNVEPNVRCEQGATAWQAAMSTWTGSRSSTRTQSKLLQPHQNHHKLSPFTPRINIITQDQSSSSLRTQQSWLRTNISHSLWLTPLWDLHQSLMLRMSWVANELVCDAERFYMECVREPPEWFLWYLKQSTFDKY